MASIQFIGRKAVVEAVTSRGLPLWGLFQSKQFITAGEGAPALDEFLKKLEPGGAGPIYILKVYRDGDPEDITDKTEAYGSFGFKLDPNLSEKDSGVAARLARLEDIITGAGDDDDEEEDDDDLSSIIMGYIKDPQKLALVIGAFRGLGAGSLPTVAGAVGTVGQVPEAFPEDDQAKAYRLSIVLDRLERADPKIFQHLEKLADLAEKKPDLFKLLLNQLDAGL